MSISLYVVIALICGTIALLIGRKKGTNPLIAFALGALLGVFGIVGVLLLPSEAKGQPGTYAAKCVRCGAKQNVAQPEFECWQCKTTQHVSGQVLS